MRENGASINGQVELPTGWKWKTIGEVATVIRGVTFKKAESGDTPAEDHIPVLRSGNVQKTLLTNENLVYVPSQRVKEEQLLRPGDIVVSVSNSLELLGKAAPLEVAWEGSIGAFLTIIRPRDENSSRFLASYVKSNLWKASIRAVASATNNIANISMAKLQAIQIPLPPQEEQSAIVGIIDELFRRVQVLEAELGAIHSLQNQLHRVLRRDACGGRLLLAADQNGSHGPTEMLPPRWTVKRLQDLAENLDRKRVPVNRKERAERPGDVPYYGATGQVGWIDDAIFDEDLVLLGEDGVQFLDSTAQKAYRISGRSWVNNHAHVLRPNRTMVSDAFLCLALNTVSYSGYVNGTTRLKLTQAKMNDLLIPCPPRAEQDQIVSALNEELGRLEILNESAKTAGVQLESFRQAVLHKAFSGELAERVPTQGLNVCQTPC